MWLAPFDMSAGVFASQLALSTGEGSALTAVREAPGSKGRSAVFTSFGSIRS